jgi:hypothetical protein
MGRTSIVSYDLVQSVDQKFCERWCFTISEVSCEFPQISRAVLYQIFTVMLRYHKFRARWVPGMFTGVHKTQRMASALTFFYSDATKIAMDFSITCYE